MQDHNFMIFKTKIKHNFLKFKNAQKYKYNIHFYNLKLIK